jgi:GTP-binding protein HflX
VLVTDTVGFVRKLPHQLVEAFHSTLEVVNEADLLVHVVDSSAPDPEGQIDAVRAVLGEIGAADVPEILVFNKADVASEAAQSLTLRHPGAVVISAATGQGVDVLLGAIAHQLRVSAHIVELSIPYSRGDVLAALHREGEVLTVVEGEQATAVRAKLAGAALAQFAPFLTSMEAGPDEGDGGAAPSSLAREAG